MDCGRLGSNWWDFWNLGISSLSAEVVDVMGCCAGDTFFSSPDFSPPDELDIESACWAGMISGSSPPLVKRRSHAMVAEFVSGIQVSFHRSLPTSGAVI